MMAIRQIRTIVFNILGDGTSTTISIDLSSAPVSLVPENGGFSGSDPKAITQPDFNFRVAPPASIVGVNIGSGEGVGIAGSLERSILTLTYDTAPVAGSSSVVIRLAF